MTPSGPLDRLTLVPVPHVLDDVVVPILNCETQICPYYGWWMALALGCWC